MFAIVHQVCVHRCLTVIYWCDLIVSQNYIYIISQCLSVSPHYRQSLCLWCFTVSHHHIISNLYVSHRYAQSLCLSPTRCYTLMLFNRVLPLYITSMFVCVSPLYSKSLFMHCHLPFYTITLYPSLTSVQ